MDRAAKGDLAADLRAAAAAGSAVLVATHDPEFAALVADRVVLLADGRPIADGPTSELLSGGWYFATETARIVDGALLPEDGADILRARMTDGGAPMSWPLASFAILAVAIGGGFRWYERARPSAKLLALVATLAALAALGRVAFAPIPSVKPTTDIVLLAGYVLGGAPGFVVGAVAALASNVFFGQGPFTPWQMAGWGAAGLLGAGLARVFGRDLGRWSLAAACAVAGLLYGSFLDLHLWVLYSTHTWEEYLLVAGRGVPFNVAHAASNVVFCLAFGPLLVRALDRYRDRLEVTWIPLPATEPSADRGAGLKPGFGGGGVLPALRDRRRARRGRHRAEPEPGPSRRQQPDEGDLLPRPRAERRRRLRRGSRARRRIRCTRAGR